ncbi:MAG TPA: DUF1598 domain-containing protein [Pirellulales bacterium]|jgi:hypothetical protein|nr:DUF1598 domain-containing protein [Pirellulales bacterium]
MSWCRPSARVIGRASFAVLVALSWVATAPEACAQFVTQQVGGVSIDAQGVVTNVRLDELNQLKLARQQAFQPVNGDLKGAALRKVSLRQLEAAIAEHRKHGTPIPDEMRYLAGLQRIQYVFVYPQTNDIVLAGPGEGWKLNGQSEVVGAVTNRPVLLLDDLLVALRAIDAAQQSGITCSIDPTSEGLGRLQSLLKNVHQIDGDPEPIADDIRKSVGPQTITVRGVPESSHFARVLVAADYRMKRLAMALDESPIHGLPSFLQMMKGSGKGARSLMPRWWLEPDYDAIVKDADGLAWELPRGSVKAMTEEEFMAAGGQRVRSGQMNPLAKKWADNMTAHYEELSTRDSIFGQLRNCMDLAVVAALISKEHLTEKCGWSMPLLMDAELPVESYFAPRQVDSQTSLMQKGTNWIISVSGGVQLAPWQMLDRTTAGANLEAPREKAAAGHSGRWWWN